MKIKHITYSMLLFAAVFSACKKNAVQVIDVPVNGALVKYYNFAVNGPVVNFFANDVKVSAAVSTTGVESATGGVAYNGVFPSTNAYAVIQPGSYTFKANRPSTATPDPGATVTTITGTVELGKYYSLYTSGLYNTTTKTSDGFIVEDVLPKIDTSGAYVRLVHAISNANPLDFYLKNTTTGVETKVASAVAYKSASQFFKLPFGVYDLFCRYPNTTTNAISRTAVSILPAYTYTFSLRGDITVTSTTAANRPFIDNTPNR